MKIIIFLLLSYSCTQKYETYHVIEKNNFDKNSFESPISKKMRPGKKVQRNFCTGQFFFFKNAKKATDRYANNVMSSLCPGSNYVLNSKITDTWWTTIVYSRSCVEIESFCPFKPRS